ncbi:alpha beta-hydrolase [Russula compacta]|nr:alpha beta-hydrolase [Russula compacta]
MLAFAFVFAPLFLIALAGAFPFQPQSRSYSRDCNGTLIETRIGTAQGTIPFDGISRFAVRYASAQRWQDAVVAGTWQLPTGNGSSDPTMLPFPCPQSSLDPSQYSEDCLSMLLYAPAAKAIAHSTRLPVLLWVHGGSFVSGSATDPGLDGTHLANATEAIVAVMQYRLGALGFNSPDGRTNFAVGDLIASLKFLHKVLPNFGGDVSKITVAGQSSGANLIRALLATPSAAPLFRSAILHSDPMNYGFQSPAVQSKLQDYFNEQVGCSSTDTACISSLSLSTVLSASDALLKNAVGIDPSASQDEPMRPVHDGVLITNTLDSTSPFPRVSKAIILSTVMDEAAPTIYGSFTAPMNTSLYSATVLQAFGEATTPKLLASPYYQVPVLPDGQAADARVQLEQMGTDYSFRCPTWTFARSWTRHGGRAFVAQYTVGATYPDNQGIPFCSGAGVVCHEDDIEIVFGTVPNATSAQSSLVAEVQARYKSFLLTGDPNPSGAHFPRWSPATTGNFSAQNLGSPGTAAIGACNTQFWGTAGTPYAYQLFGI